MSFDDRTHLRYSYKQEVKEALPDAVCKRVQVFEDLAGYYVYESPPVTDEDLRTKYFACAGRAEDAWAKAAIKVKRMKVE
jgi:hypothetical protein